MRQLFFCLFHSRFNRSPGGSFAGPFSGLQHRLAHPGRAGGDDHAAFGQDPDLVLGFSLAAGDDRPGMPHPLSRGGRHPGDEGGHRLSHVVLDPQGRLFFGSAADLADHEDRVGFRVLVEELRGTSMNFMPMIGSPPMPTQVDWPSPTSVSCLTAS